MGLANENTDSARSKRRDSSRAGLTIAVCLLLLGSCSKHLEREYAVAWSPDGQNKAALIRVPVKLGFSSEFRFVIGGKNAHMSTVIDGTEELNWQTSFAEVFWSSDSQITGFIMSNAYAPIIAVKAIDISSGKQTDFLSLVSAVRKKMREKWGSYLDPDRDSYEQARRPGKALHEEFLLRHSAR